MGDKIKVIRFYSTVILSLLFLSFQFAMAAEESALPRVRMQTSLGDLVIELYSDKSPRTVKNFLNYANNQYYDGLIFHRVISGWLIQGGGYDDNLDYFATDPPIRNEAKNGLKNLRGTIAMARHWDPNSAESQFFINLSDNPSFDFKNRTIEGFGYCVFGKVISGIEVADAIGEVETHAAAHLGKDVPIKTVFIKKVELLE
jgi:peptidyl-prolyl cis-trans isomerase B (cyclophilin B)